MALTDVLQKPKIGKKSGGGLFGKIGGAIGTVAGAIGGAFVGNPVGGAAAGGALGGTIGGLAGETFQPGESPSPGGKVSQLERASQQNPQAQLAAVVNAQQKLPEVTSLNPEEYDRVSGVLEQAKQKLQKRLNIGGQ